VLRATARCVGCFHAAHFTLGGGGRRGRFGVRGGWCWLMAAPCSYQQVLACIAWDASTC
jgi:hypothetical protein